MIDERAEELACLRALGLDAPAGFAEAEGPESRELERDLAETAAQLAYIAARRPPPSLRTRILAAAASR